MLAGRTGVPPRAEHHQVEAKWDGVRTIITVHEGSVTLRSRNDNDVTTAYPELAALPSSLQGRSAVLDGEVVTAGPDGHPSFQRLQRRMHVRHPGASLRDEVPVSLVVFDLLWLDGQLLVALAQRDRRARLEELELAAGTWRATPLLDFPSWDGLLETCRNIGLEGFMVKDPAAPYLPGRRSPAWSKVKCAHRSEFVVAGWSPGQGRRAGGVGSLALGCYDLSPEEAAGAGRAARLVYVGQVGSGLSDAQLGQLRSVTSRIGRDTSPFTGPSPRAVAFLEPVLVAEVAYTGVTESGTLRQPSLQGFRTDKAAPDVVAEDDVRSCHPLLATVRGPVTPGGPAAVIRPRSAP